MIDPPAGDDDDADLPGPDAEPTGEAEGEWIESRFQVEPNYRDLRLDRYLQVKLRRLSRSRIARVIRSCLTLNGAVTKPAKRLRPGDHILIRRLAPPEPDVPRYLTVLRDAPTYVVVDKPAGLPMHPTARYYHNTVTALLKERFPAPDAVYLAHRIDRETSGLVLCGRGTEATKELKAAFRWGRVQKRYWALVHGDLVAERLVDLPLGPKPGSIIRLKMGVRPDGQPAQTGLVPLQRFGRFTLVEARPRTGRQHQIRVHCEAIGHPLVGDKLYGHDDDFFLELMEAGVTERIAAALLLPRQALHARWLRFQVPGSAGEAVEVTAPLPEDLATFLAGLGWGEAPG
jgi:23S rRNA pseudouridine1911/1915/1917 synthase